MINVFITKKTKEQSAFFIKRFNQRTQASGVLMRARKNRFAERAQSKNIKRKQALRKIGRQVELSMLWRLGKLKVTRKRGRRK